VREREYPVAVAGRARGGQIAALRIRLPPEVIEHGVLAQELEVELLPRRNPVGHTDHIVALDAAVLAGGLVHVAQVVGGALERGDRLALERDRNRIQTPGIAGTAVRAPQPRATAHHGARQLRGVRGERLAAERVRSVRFARQRVARARADALGEFAVLGKVHAIEPRGELPGLAEVGVELAGAQADVLQLPVRVELLDEQTLAIEAAALAGLGILDRLEHEGALERERLAQLQSERGLERREKIVELAVPATARRAFALPPRSSLNEAWCQWY
jgi:hypothetical protein